MLAQEKTPFAWLLLPQYDPGVVTLKMSVTVDYFPWQLTVMLQTRNAGQFHLKVKDEFCLNRVILNQGQG